MTDRPLHAFAGTAVLAVAIAALFGDHPALAAPAAVVFTGAYIALQRAVAGPEHMLTLAIGAVGVLVSLWVGYAGELEHLAWVDAGLVLALLIGWIVIHEATGVASGATRDVASTVFAAGLVGVLGAHVLLIRSLEPFGYEGLLGFGGMAIVGHLGGALTDHLLGRHAVTWEGVAAGLAGSVGIGAAIGFAIDPPFDLASGAALGALVGVTRPLGIVTFTALGSRGPSPGVVAGAFEATDGLLFAAPAFYWAFRTIAL